MTVWTNYLMPSAVLSEVAVSGRASTCTKNCRYQLHGANEWSHHSIDEYITQWISPTKTKLMYWCSTLFPDLFNSSNACWYRSQPTSHETLPPYITNTVIVRETMIYTVFKPLNHGRRTLINAFIIHMGNTWSTRHIDLSGVNY